MLARRLTIASYTNTVNCQPQFAIELCMYAHYFLYKRTYMKYVYSSTWYFIRGIFVLVSIWTKCWKFKQNQQINILEWISKQNHFKLLLLYLCYSKIGHCLLFHSLYMNILSTYVSIYSWTATYTNAHLLTSTNTFLHVHQHYHTSKYKSKNILCWVNKRIGWSDGYYVFCSFYSVACLLCLYYLR